MSDTTVKDLVDFFIDCIITRKPAEFTVGCNNLEAGKKYILEKDFQLDCFYESNKLMIEKYNGAINIFTGDINVTIAYNMPITIEIVSGDSEVWLSYIARVEVT